MVKAIFFDFWGTLVENGTYSPLKQSYNILRLRMPYGEYVERFEQALMTQQYEDQATGFEAVCQEFNIEPKPIIIDKLIGVWNKNKLLAKPYPETIETLKQLKEKHKLAIVSNAPYDSVHEILEKFNMTELFDEVFVSAHEGTLKTHKLFDVALKKLGLTKTDVVMVGDSIESDIRGAEAAGIKAFLIDRKDRREYKNKITSLEQLEGAL